MCFGKLLKSVVQEDRKIFSKMVVLRLAYCIIEEFLIKCVWMWVLL